jgi:protein arginine kinase activator
MICQFCKKREATIHFTNVVGNKVNKIHICHHCAEEKGFDYLKKSNFAMGDLISGLFETSSEQMEPGSTKDKCPNCGMNFESFKKMGRLGCSHCYESFESELLPLLRSIHGNTTHMGKVPKRFCQHVNLQRKVRELQEELGRAVEREDYERAAEIRDELKTLRRCEEK